MSKRHRSKQVAKVQQLLNGERSSLFIIAYPQDANYLKGKFPIKLYCTGPVYEVHGLYWFKVVKA